MVDDSEFFFSSTTRSPALNRAGDRATMSSSVATQSRLSSALNLSRNLVFALFLLRHLGASWRHLRARGLLTTAHELYLSLARYIASLVMLAPPAKRRVQSELAKADKDVRAKLAPSSDVLETHNALPREGKPAAWISEELDRLEAMDAANWKSGRVSGAIYHGHSNGELGGVIEKGAFVSYDLRWRC